MIFRFIKQVPSTQRYWNVHLAFYLEPDEIMLKLEIFTVNYYYYNRHHHYCLHHEGMRYNISYVTFFKKSNIAYSEKIA